MAARPNRREIILSTATLEALREIWLWNANTYGEPHADGYLKFVEESIGTLANPKTVGLPIADRPELRYLLIRRRRSGHGHLAVFHVSEMQVAVLRLFHTAHDWQSALSEDL